MKLVLIVLLTFSSFSAFAAKSNKRVSKKTAKEFCLSKDSSLSGKKLSRCIQKRVKGK